MKCASIHLRSGYFYLASSSRTTTGLWIDTAPFLRLEEGVSDIALGEVILNALNASTHNVAPPHTWEEASAPLLRLAKVKSWRTFMKLNSYASLELDEFYLKIVPHRNLENGASIAIPEKTVVLPADCLAPVVGAVARNALLLRTEIRE